MRAGLTPRPLAAAGAIAASTRMPRVESDCVAVVSSSTGTTGSSGAGAAAGALEGGGKDDCRFDVFSQRYSIRGDSSDCRRDVRSPRGRATRERIWVALRMRRRMRAASLRVQGPRGVRAGRTRETRMSTSALDRDIAGLDYVRRLITGEIATVPIAELLNMRIVEAQLGRVSLVGSPDQRSYNRIGSVDGGWPASILGTAMGLAVLSQLEPERTATTIDLRVSYLRGVTRATGDVHAVGRVVNAGRRLAYCESTLSDG